MKRVLLFLLLAALWPQSAHAQRKLNERHATVANGYVRIFMLSGSVTVIGWDRDSLAVTGTVWETPGNRFAVGTTAKGAKLGLWSDVEDGKPSHITVYAPLRSQVWVKTTGADIKVSGLGGSIDLFSISGNIDVSGTPRDVHAETMGGNIVLRASATTALVKTAAGSLTLSGAISDLTATTVSGAINASDLQYSRARIESVEGDIRFNGGMPAASTLELTNHAGAVELTVPRNTSSEFMISRYAGELVVEGLDYRKKPTVSFKDREVLFWTGKGAAKVTVRTFKGLVKVLGS